ncbi:hypothetical protein MBLNU230_g7294t1 [Neophaeotheca triangularis]
MKLVLSTSNIMGGGSSIHRPSKSKSNTELISSLRNNFESHSTPPPTNGYREAKENNHNNSGNNSNGTSTPSETPRLPYNTWTRPTTPPAESTLEIPALDFSNTALQEEREQYDITLKLFYLPSTSPAASDETIETRAAQTRSAVDLVLRELHMPSIDLLIVSFPGIYFDEEEDCPDKISTRGPVEAQPEELASQLATWRTLEALHDEGVVKKLGLAEFGHDRLAEFVESVRVRPSVDQINLRDCCSVPRPLMALAKKEGVELLVHNDCSNILPRGTVRELLGPGGAGVLAEGSKTGEKRKSLHLDDASGKGLERAQKGESLKGEVRPLWVVKYTAVVKNRGVVENKGYFAVAEVGDD